jgi:hypothetical protein
MDVSVSGTVAFERLAHLVVVPVTLDGVERSFVLDSGIGLTVVRQGIPGCSRTGETYTGERMSGQAVPVPLAVTPALDFAGRTYRDATVGILDMSGFPQELAHVDGFLSLGQFEHEPLTVDYPGGSVAVGEPRAGVECPVRVERDGPAVTVFLPLTLPDGRSAEVEVDMGSESLILDERFAALGAGEARVVEGVDETGHDYVRRFMRLDGRVHPTAAPSLAQDDPAVMFQSIVHDGLIGTDFLGRFAVTFDLARELLVLA